ncbi:type VI secretion system baseplate subunit TssK [Achromobacter sp. AGC25]
MTDLQPVVTDAVEWHEGMLLAPQHFQLLASRLDTLVAWQTLAAAPFSWGVRRLVLDSGLLPAGIVRVLELSAIMPDGTAIAYSAQADGAAALELALDAHAAQLADGPIDFHVTLPVATLTRREGQLRRCRSVAGAPVEDQVSEAPAADIARLQPNLVLSAGTVPSAQFVALRLGSLYKDNEVVRLGERQPPLLEVRLDNPLWLGASALLGQLRGKAAFIARQTANPSSRVDDRLTQLELRDKLRSLLAGLPMAEAVLRTPHLHPWTLYLALASLAGSLCLLKPGAMPPPPPDYDHGDPLAVFTPLLRFLREASAEISEDFRQYKFDFNHGAFELGLRQDWIGERLVVGVRGQSDRDLLAWMAGAVIGSLPVYPSLRSRRVLGATRRNVEYAEELGLRSGSGYLLFEIQATPGLVLGDEPLLIANSNEGESAQRPQEMLLFVKG